MCVSGTLFRSLVFVNLAHTRQVHGGRVTLSPATPRPNPGAVLVAWRASPVNDMWADAIVAAVLNIDDSLAALRCACYQRKGDTVRVRVCACVSIKCLHCHTFSGDAADSRAVQVVEHTHDDSHDRKEQCPAKPDGLVER